MNTVLFDLDGTLLPMDQDAFVQGYFAELAKKFAPRGIDGKTLVKCVWAGTKEMINNDGSMTNETRFWNTFSSLMGDGILKLRPEFDEFYRSEFNNVKEKTGYTPIAAECLAILKGKGYRLVAATNPIFPRDATVNRLKWAGVDPGLFEYITTYEHCSYCKPDLNYYKEILAHTRLDAKDCLMVGNDVREDMCVSSLGMDTYLVNDCIINTGGADLSRFKQGSFSDFREYAATLPALDS